jgi:predicted nucleotide-binding protein
MAWVLKADEFLKNNFGEGSSFHKQFKYTRDNITVLGNEQRHFENVISRFIGTLKGAYEFPSEEVSSKIERPENIPPNNKVFIVHGHDDSLKNELESFLRELGLEPIILHKQPDRGNTLIEKIEENSDVGFAVILLTPDDVGYSAQEAVKEDSQRIKNSRARQNVILELGYFVGKLGRDKVCCIHKKSIELPTDINGLLYKSINENLDDIKWSLTRELKAAGYNINF